MKLCKLGEGDWCTIFDTLRDSPQNKIARWDLKEQRINLTVVKSLVAYAASSDSLVEVNACGQLRDSLNFGIRSALLFLRLHSAPCLSSLTELPAYRRMCTVECAHNPVTAHV